MRNLKRVLSLALASVMLLGMMVIGASATSFTDDAEIVYTEAVEITAGLGLFAGSDGKFMPKGTVTRAQMATIIVKMLYGSGINADQYKGVGTFSDTAAFEGGWAEGYINLCANLKVVAGYPDGTFKPGNQVTTAEAVTMIINALGVDAGTGSWPLTVMSKAEEMKLFEDLSPKPGTNVALTRDELAAIVLPGLKYSPSGATGYTLDTTTGKQVSYDNYADALSSAIQMWGAGTADSHISENIGDDALATKTFDMKSAEGMVVANQATDYDATYTQIGATKYAIETGLDMIGHKVTVYYKDAYKSDKEPGTAYAIVDDCETYVVDTAITKAAEYKAVFGTEDITPTAAVNTFNASYALTGTIAAPAAGIYDYTNKTVAIGTYVAYEGKLYSYLAPAVTTATKVTGIVTTAGKESINVSGFGTLKNNEDVDEVIEYAGIAKDDIVLAVKAGTTVTLTKLNTVEGKITKTTVDSKGHNLVTVNGTAYGKFDDYGATYKVNGALNAGVPTNFDNTYRFYVTEDGKYVHYETIEGQADLSSIVYVFNVYAVDSKDEYGVKNAKVFAQAVDMDGKIESYLLGVYKWDGAKYVAFESGTGYTSALPNEANVFGKTFNVNNEAAPLSTGAVAKGFYTFDKATNSKLAALDIVTAKAVGTTYDANTTPIYAKKTDTAVTIDSKTSSLHIDEGNAYLTAATKFVVFNGTGATATATVITGRLTDTFAVNTDVLVSRNASGNRLLEVAILDKDPDAVSTADYVYVTAGSYAGKNANGYEYDVYTSKGEVTRIVSDAAAIGAGFYTYAVDAEGKYTLTAASAAKVAMGDKFATVFNNKIETAALSEYDVSSAIVVDVRDSEVIADSDFAGYEITTLDELVSLMSDEDNLPAIILDIYFGLASDQKVEMIFITKITSVSLDSTALYFANAAAATQTLTATCSPYAEVITWDSTNKAVATVNAAGVVTPKATGTTTITATTASGATATCTVTVG